MAARKKKAPELSRREKRRLRTQQLIFVAIGILVVAAMLLQLVA